MKNSQKVIHNTHNQYEYYIVSGKPINDLLPIAFVILKNGEMKQLSIEYFPTNITSDELIAKVTDKINNIQQEKSLPDLYFELEQLIVNKNYKIIKEDSENGK